MLKRIDGYSKPVYVTDNIYDIKRLLLGSPDLYRFIYCDSSDSYIIGRSFDYTHLDLADIAIDNYYSTEKNWMDAIINRNNSDIVSFAYAPGVYNNNEEGKEELRANEFQMPICYQYNHGVIGYRGPSKNNGIRNLLNCFGKYLYIIDLSDTYY